MKKCLVSIVLSLLIIVRVNTPCYADKQGQPLKEMHVPPAHSTEELYQDIFMSLLLPNIQKAVDDYYKEYLTETPAVAPYQVFVMSAKRLGEYRSLAFELRLKVLPYIGPHDVVGEDIVTVQVGAGEKPVIEKFEHINGNKLPPNYQDIIKKKYW